MLNIYRKLILKHAVEPVKSVTINSNLELVVRFIQNDRIVKGKIDVGFRLFINVMNHIHSVSKDDNDTNMYVKESLHYFQFLGFKPHDKANIVGEHGDKFFIEFSSMQ